MSKQVGRGTRQPIPTPKRNEVPSVGAMPNFGDSEALRIGKIVLNTPKSNLKVPKR